MMARETGLEPATSGVTGRQKAEQEQTAFQLSTFPYPAQAVQKLERIVAQAA